jgi:5-dehydro-2-deoxygluconokinase
MPRGYDRALYILPFDHPGSFQAKAQTAEIGSAKEVIYDGFNAALASDLPKEKNGILVDEQFGGAGRLAEQKGDARANGRRDRKRYHEFVDLFERASHYVF